MRNADDSRGVLATTMRRGNGRTLTDIYGDAVELPPISHRNYDSDGDSMRKHRCRYSVTVLY